MSEWVAVCLDEHDEPVEIPTEGDGTLSLASVCAQFPGASGLKYRNPDTNTLRGIRVQGDTLYPPTQEGWGLATYFCVRAKEDSPKKDEPRLKRKTESDVDMYSKNIKVESEDEDSEDKTSDLIILGLPWKTSEDDIREYFEPFGEVIMVQLKKRPGSGESKGFAFIRFAEKEVEKKVLLQRHMIDGRWCDIKIPDSQDKKDGKPDKSSCKIFVGRVTENLSKEDLRDHFETFGQVGSIVFPACMIFTLYTRSVYLQVTDVYIPTPFRQFAFVQFSESRVAQSLLGKEHIIKGVSVKIGEAAPKGRDHGGNMGRDRGRFGGYDGGYSTGGSSGGWGGNKPGGFGGAQPGPGGPGGNNGGFSVNWGSGGGYSNSGPSWGGPSFGMGAGPGPSYGGSFGGGNSGFGGNNGGGFGGKSFIISLFISKQYFPSRWERQCWLQIQWGEQLGQWRR